MTAHLHPAQPTFENELIRAVGGEAVMRRLGGASH